MNEAANIQVIRSTYAAFNAADLTAIMSFIAEDSTWHNQGPANIPYAGTYNGKTEIPRFFQAIAESTSRSSRSISAWSDCSVKVSIACSYRWRRNGTSATRIPGCPVSASRRR